MPDPHWSGYVGMITGMAGLILSIASYRKANALKRLDLRLELRRALVDLRIALDSLPDLINKATRSRNAVLAAAGQFQSGSTQRWRAEVEEDDARIKQLQAEAPNRDENFRGRSPEALESELVVVRQLQKKVDGLIGKYNAAMEEDIRTQEAIRHAKANPRS